MTTHNASPIHLSHRKNLHIYFQVFYSLFGCHFPLRAKGLPLAAHNTLGCAVYQADVMSPPPTVPFPPDYQVRRSAVAMETSPKEHDIIIHML